MDLTVLLCTYNRSALLERSLASVLVCQVPAGVRWEVLVVDNNSKDQTRDVVTGLIRQHPDRLRYLFEGQQGKSFALNSGIQDARGRIIAFVDDDVTVDSLWLWALTKELLADSCAGAGGKVVPMWTSEPPSWLPLTEPHGLAPLAAFDLGNAPGRLKEPPFGTNMAFQKQVFAKHGTFRTDLGPRPGSEIRSEDTEFGQRLIDSGERLHYAADAIVYHPVPDERLTKQYFLRWWFDKGRADVREEAVPVRDGFKVAGVPLALFRHGLGSFAHWTLARDPRLRFAYRTHVWTLAGQIAEFRHSRAFSPKPQ